MSNLTDQEFAEIQNTLKKIAPHIPRSVNARFKVNGNYRSLIRSVTPKLISIAKDAREFRSDEPIYVRRIDIYGPDIEKILSGLSLIAQRIDGEPFELAPSRASTTKADGSPLPCVRYVVKSVCTAVVVRSTLPYRSLQLTKIDVLGYSYDQLELIAKRVGESLDIVERLESYVAEKQAAVSSAKTEKSELDEQIASTQENLASLKDAKKDAEQEAQDASSILAGLTEKNNALTAILTSAQSSLEAVKNNEAQLTSQNVALNREVSLRKGELQRLVNDRSLISDEYKDYVKEGGRQSLWYMALLLVALAVMAFCAFQIYAGANRILTADVTTFEGLAVLSLQRAPLAAALALIVTVCWKMSAALISRVMVIHSQRLGLARLLVIAKDTVYSSTDGLEIPDELKFRERIRLKLAMLRSHLTAELGKEFSYGGDSEASHSSESDNQGAKTE